jgi:hypothetical protein
MRNLIAMLLVCACGDDPTTAPLGDAAPEPDAPKMIIDVTTPFPIDGDALPNAPDTYKGLPLTLVDNGAPTITPVRGVIGVVCIGMSNSNQECGDFIMKLDTAFAGQFNAEVRVVNCAVGGHAIERWNDPAHDATLWDACLDTRLGQRNLAVDQIRVVYHKAANQFTTTGNGAVKPPYPDPASDYFAFRENLTTFATRVPQKFPAAQAVYTTSRSYGGFANQASRGEPLSYEEGHALNTWLGENASIRDIWYGWGPYVWAPDCANGMNGSGTCYVRDDYVMDGVHPNTGARDKISQLIHARFLRDAWYQP